MKILQIASGDYLSTYGGGQVYVRRLVSALQRMPDIEVLVASQSADTSGVEKTYVDGVLVYCIPDKDYKDTLTQVIKKNHPDVVHIHGMERECCQVCTQLRIPCVVTAHHGGMLCPAGALLNAEGKICRCVASHKNCLGCVLNTIRWGKWAIPFMKRLPQSLYFNLGKILARLPFMWYVTPVGQAAYQIQSTLEEWNAICMKSDKIIAPSLAISEAMGRHALDKQKVTVIPHGVEKYDDFPLFPVLIGHNLRFYYVGRINYVKGTHVLVRAFMQVAAENIELHIIGGATNTQEKRYMAQLRRESASDKRIVWHGKLAENELPRQTGHYHILVNPSICLETFGLNIAEALSAGKWVLSTRCGGAEMQIKDRENGWLVKPNSVSAIKEALEHIIETPPKASPAYIGYISQEEHALRVLRIYREVVAEKSTQTMLVLERKGVWHEEKSFN